jgi:hypothetical protein
MIAIFILAILKASNFIVNICYGKFIKAYSFKAVTDNKNGTNDTDYILHFQIYNVLT